MHTADVKRRKNSGYSQLLLGTVFLVGAILLAFHAAVQVRDQGWTLELMAEVFLASIVAVVSVGVLFRGWNDLLISRGRIPYWLIPPRRDDWGRGRIQKRASLRTVFEVAGPVVVTIGFGVFVPDTLWRLTMGILVIAWGGAGVYRLLRWMRSGRAAVDMGRIPVRAGETLAGWIETSLAEPPVYFEVKLSCVERPHDADQPDVFTLWHRERTVLPVSYQWRPSGIAVPFRFEIPPDAKVTDRNESVDIDWYLEAYADIPGIDFHVSFDVPVVAPDAVGHFYPPGRRGHPLGTRVKSEHTFSGRVVPRGDVAPE